MPFLLRPMEYLLFRDGRCAAGYTLTAHSQAEPLNRQPSGLPIGEVSSYAAKDACNASRPSLRPYNVYPAAHLALGISIDLRICINDTLRAAQAESLRSYNAYAGLHLLSLVCCFRGVRRVGVAFLLGGFGLPVLSFIWSSEVV